MIGRIHWPLYPQQRCCRWRTWREFIWSCLPFSVLLSAKQPSTEMVRKRLQFFPRQIHEIDRYECDGEPGGDDLLVRYACITVVRV